MKQATRRDEKNRTTTTKKRRTAKTRDQELATAETGAHFQTKYTTRVIAREGDDDAFDVVSDSGESPN